MCAPSCHGPNALSTARARDRGCSLDMPNPLGFSACTHGDEFVPRRVTRRASAGSAPRRVLHVARRAQRVAALRAREAVRRRRASAGRRWTEDLPVPAAVRLCPRGDESWIRGTSPAATGAGGGPLLHELGGRLGASCASTWNGRLPFERLVRGSKARVDTSGNGESRTNGSPRPQAGCAASFAGAHRGRAEFVRRRQGICGRGPKEPGSPASVP